MWEAAQEFVNRTNCLKSTQTITTVADQSDYTLNADFVRLYIRNTDKNFILKYNDGNSNTFLTWKEYGAIIYGDNTDSVSIPSHFTLIDDSLDSSVSGTATANGASTNGTATLTDSTANFADVSAGDSVHNTTDGSDGIVLSKTSSTVLVTALFGGTDNDWDTSDAYVLQPQGRMKIVLDPPPSTAGHTITVYYIQKPAPVFSPYGIYRFPQQYTDVLIKYAIWLYKYKDGMPDYGDKYYQMFDRAARRYSSNIKETEDKYHMSISFRKR